MNSHLPPISHVQPAIPLYNGRRPHELAYTPPSSSHHPQFYHGYQQPQYSHGPPPQHFQQQPPPQWYQYQHPMARPYSHYSPMVNAPYQMQQHQPPVQHHPHPPYHAPSSSSIHSHQDMLSPSSSTTSLHVPSIPPPSTPNPYLASTTPPSPPSRRMPYYPPLPWYSFAEGSLPPRRPRRRRQRRAPQSSSIAVELPTRDGSLPGIKGADGIKAEPDNGLTPEPLQDNVTADLPEDLPMDQQQNNIPVHQYLETPQTSHAPSESDSTQPTTPSSVVIAAPLGHQQAQNTKALTRAAFPVVPIVPIVPNVPIAVRPTKRVSVSITSDSKGIAQSLPSTIAQTVHATDAIDTGNGPASLVALDPMTTCASPPEKAAPRRWADLVKTPAAITPGKVLHEGDPQANGFTASKSGSLADALSSFSMNGGNGDSKISFLEPRGLINTGNMCYMNSVLQILVFCIPFYDCLERIGRRAVHNFKSDTPLVDTMIMFMREFSVIDSAVSVEQLRMRLRDNELEQYGEAFTPEFVYEVIRRLPRFSSMRRGHQQDAEEFLGFLLEEMHDECSRAMKSANSKTSSGASTPTNGVVSPVSNSTESTTAGDGGWLEVGPKQKSAITRSSGAIITESPITKIFGGKLRSELRVPGMKNSVTLEPYQPLQLDIGAPQVNNIVDALKGLTRPETLHGDFHSPRGPGALATKQVTIETLPPVLILHLKRFQYDNTGGTQKIWKKVGYPLELEIPKEVFPQHKRGGLIAHGGLPKYRLIGVVYHHGKTASGGHYTVDVRRQDGREWIRLDDTIIRRVRSEDVAEGGSEEDPKILAAALEQHKNDQSSSDNFYDGFATEGEEQAWSGKGWNQVNGVASGSAAKKQWSSVVNGNATPAPSSGKITPTGRSSVKDNKVAYLLFYQGVGA